VNLLAKRSHQTPPIDDRQRWRRHWTEGGIAADRNLASALQTVGRLKIAPNRRTPACPVGFARTPKRRKTVAFAVTVHRNCRRVIADANTGHGSGAQKWVKAAEEERKRHEGERTDYAKVSGNIIEVPGHRTFSEALERSIDGSPRCANADGPPKLKTTPAAKRPRREAGSNGSRVSLTRDHCLLPVPSPSREQEYQSDARVRVRSSGTKYRRRALYCRTGHPFPLPPCLAGRIGRSRYADRLRP
jgi:hypothetical protein